MSLLAGCHATSAKSHPPTTAQHRQATTGFRSLSSDADLQANSSLSGLRPAIDPAQIPSPVDIRDTDQERWWKESYLTCSSQQTVPLATSDFHAIDQGQSPAHPVRISLQPSIQEIHHLVSYEHQLMLYPTHQNWHRRVVSLWD